MVQTVDKVTCIGLNKRGLCLALSIEHVGISVLAYDENQTIIDGINDRHLESPEPGVEDLVRDAKKIQGTTDFETAVNYSDVFFISSSPLKSSKKDCLDHQKLREILTKMNDLKLTSKHIVLCSTVMPGFIRNTASKLVRECENTTVSYSPPLVAQGDMIRGFRLGGAFGLTLIGEGSREIGDILEDIYRRMADLQKPNICRMTPESAEITKLGSNCFRALKIAFSNMLGDLADMTSGADKNEICRALAHDQSIGPYYMKPGYGFGGPSYNRDNTALAMYADSIGVQAILPIAADQSNKKHAEFMAKEFLTQNLSEYVFEDVTFKPRCPVPTIEGSQKLAVAVLLVNAGKKVIIRDRRAVILEVKKQYGDIFEYIEIREPKNGSYYGY